MEGIMEVIRQIRNMRSEMNVPAGRRTRLMILPSEGWQETIAHASLYFARLAGVSQSSLIASASDVTEKTVTSVTYAGTLYIPLGDLVDIDKEIARLGKEHENLVKEIERTEGKLNNPGFVSKAPAALVQGEREKLEKNRARLEALSARIQELKESK
jgi:valyl-tRNA synthetase